jgi:membrane-associated protein
MGDLLHPEAAIEAFGYIGLFLIVFAESGLLVGFFLPGDSLLFTAGLFASRPIPGTDQQLNIVAVIVICVVAAILGDQFGYLFGRRVGPSIFRKPNSKIFKQAYVEKSQQFFEAHGPKTIVLARFVPIVRTFAPVLAGVGRMNYRTFVTYNVGGGLLWGVGVPVIGYFLGQVEFVRDNLEVMIFIIVGISVIPVIFEVLRGRLKGRRAPVAERLARLEDAVSDDDEVDATK